MGEEMTQDTSIASSLLYGVTAEHIAQKWVLRQWKDYCLDRVQPNPRRTKGVLRRQAFERFG